MPSRDIRPEVDPQTSLAPSAYAAPANGTGVNLAGAEAALITIQTGSITSGTYKVQESTDNASWNDVADSDLIGITGNTGGVAVVATSVVKASYIGSKQYVRVILTAATACNLAALVTRAHLRYTAGQPV